MYLTCFTTCVGLSNAQTSPHAFQYRTSVGTACLPLPGEFPRKAQRKHRIENPDVHRAMHYKTVIPAESAGSASTRLEQGGRPVPAQNSHPVSVSGSAEAISFLGVRSPLQQQLQQRSPPQLQQPSSQQQLQQPSPQQLQQPSPQQHPQSSQQQLVNRNPFVALQNSSRYNSTSGAVIPFSPRAVIPTLPAVELGLIDVSSCKKMNLLCEGLCPHVEQQSSFSLRVASLNCSQLLCDGLCPTSGNSLYFKHIHCSRRRRIWCRCRRVPKDEQMLWSICFPTRAPSREDPLSRTDVLLLRKPLYFHVH